MATGHQIGDIFAVLVTHFHPDHYGLVHRVREVSGAWVGMHEAEALAVSRFMSEADRATASRAWLARRGVPAREIEEMLQTREAQARLRTRPDIMIHDGAYPLGEGTLLRAIWTPGHTPGHLCFAEERYNLLLTGDHVLPRISPNISRSPLITNDPLGSFLHSLTRLAEFDPHEILPAHEYRFSGLSMRLRQLREHHRSRLKEILAVVEEAPDCTTADVAGQLTWSRPWGETRGFVRRSAVGETHAHLVYLERCGLLINHGAAGSSAEACDTDRWRLAHPLARLTELAA